MYSTPQQSRGFTLIELLCVIIIIAIAAVLVIPQMGARGDLKAAAAARTLMADLTYAQNRAIAKQATQYVMFTVASGTYQVQEGSPPATETHPVTLVPFVQTFGSTGLEDVTLTSANFDGKSIIAFDELGAPYAYDSVNGTVALVSGAIKIASEGYTMTLNIEPYTGEVALTTP